MKTNTSPIVRWMILLSAAVIYVGPLAPSALAQFQWSQRVASTTSWPGDVPDVGLALDTNANCYVTGWFDGTNNFGGITLTNQSTGGGSDIFVAKYNASGALQWAQKAGGTVGNQNTGNGIGTDTNGNVYVTGGVYGSANFGNTNLPASPYENFFLAKYNNSGGVQWVQQSAGGVGNIDGTGMAVDGAGNSYALMFVDNYQGGVTLTFGTTNITIPIQDGLDTILIKYNSAGAVQWDQLLGSTGEVWTTKDAVDAAGNVYVQGVFEQNMTIGNTNLMVNPANATNNGFIAKFNSSGTLTWVQQLGGGNVSEGGVAVDPGGNVFVSGAFGGNLNFGNGISLTNTATNAPFVNAFVAKYNSLGVIQWAEEAGGTNGGDYFDIALDGQTNIYAAGGLISGAAVSKFSPAGTLQWTYAANGPPANPVGSIVTKCAVDTAGHCYLAGWYQGGTAAFGTNTLQPQETLNFFLAETVTNPTVQFSASPASSLPPLTVQFNSTNVDSQGNTISSWKWNFGDGTTTNTQNPSHTYTNVATFYPSFVATNISGVSVIGFGPLITTTNISAANPTIQFTANPTNGLPPLAVQFNSSNVDSLGNAITSWNWNFGDGTTTNTQNPLHTYTIANIFLPSLTATNSRGVAVVGNGPQIATLTPTPSTCFSYTINNGAITITGYTCSGGAVNIPSMINGLPVTVIGAAFENNNNVTSVTIPDSVTSIGDHAFDSCYNLTSVTIGNSVTHIGEWAFSVCNLTNVTIPNSVTSIGDGAFNDCPLLTNVTIPNSITSIGGEMFRYCGLTSIMIPQSVTSIGSSAFEYCDSLTSITIPNSVTSIGSSAFADCTGLKAAYFQGNAPSADCTVFQGDSVTVYYLPGMTGWGSSFACVPTAAWILQVATTNLPRGTNGVPYSQQLSAIYGQTPYTWTNISGALPPGLTLAANGVISGTPMSGGTNNFTVKVTDALSATATQALMLTVVGPPIITIQPTNNSIWVPVGSNVTFSVSVSGTGPFSYQWRLNSNNLPNGIITTVAGGGHGGQNGLGDGLGDGGAATDATLWNPFGVAVDVTGNLFIADQANYRIRKVGITGIINTVAGNGSYAGTGTGDYSGDGSAATNAELFFPDGVAVDAAGNLFIADSYNNVIRKVGTNGIINTVAGNGTANYSGDGGAATNAELNTPEGVAVDATGNLFIADWGNNVIRKVGTSGIIITVAGNGSNGYSGDGGAATNAELFFPDGVAVDAAGNLFIADSYNNVIRKVGTNGIITTVAGNGTANYSGDGGAATNAELNTPEGVAVDAVGNLFIADSYNNVIRDMGTNGIITTVAGNGSYAGTGTGDYSGDGSAATNAELFFPDGVAVDAAGNLFIADSYNNVIRKVVLPRGSTLVLNDVGFGNAGAYDVVVSGPYGSVTSSVVNVVVTLPVILSSPQITVGKTNFTFQLSGPAGSNYVLQVSTNLLNWDPISTSAIPVSGSINLTNTMSGYKQSFYQVHLQ